MVRYFQAGSQGHCPAAEPKARLSVARNPKATYDYFVLDTMEAGVVLTGTEVKSLRRRGASIKEAFARVYKGEVWLEGMNITPYEQGNRYNHDPVRSRKLLLRKKEIEQLIGSVERQGLAGAARAYSRWSREDPAALARGKKAHDKRETSRSRSPRARLRARHRGRDASESACAPHRRPRANVRGGPTGPPADQHRAGRRERAVDAAGGRGAVGAARRARVGAGRPRRRP
ncbi:MAG: SsrA-binding protein SmpB [Gemmatimonadetes bacterium]|nr:SsrA-binding protein SmpB [Gemmatimonadota bacterium]